MKAHEYVDVPPDKKIERIFPDVHTLSAADISSNNDVLAVTQIQLANSHVQTQQDQTGSVEYHTAPRPAIEDNTDTQCPRTPANTDNANIDYEPRTDATSISTETIHADTSDSAHNTGSSDTTYTIDAVIMVLTTPDAVSAFPAAYIHDATDTAHVPNEFFILTDSFPMNSNAYTHRAGLLPASAHVANAVVHNDMAIINDQFDKLGIPMLDTVM